MILIKLSLREYTQSISVSVYMRIFVRRKLIVLNSPLYCAQVEAANQYDAAEGIIIPEIQTAEEVKNVEEVPEYLSERSMCHSALLRSR